MNRIEYVVGFLFSKDKELVALIRKNKPAWQKGKLNGIGGKLKEDETPHEAMAREFEEEAGLLVKDWTRIVVAANDSILVHFFRSFGSPYAAFSVTAETIDVYRIDSLPKACVPNLHWLIPLCLDEQIIEPVQVMWMEFAESLEQIKEDGDK